MVEKKILPKKRSSNDDSVVTLPGVSVGEAENRCSPQNNRWSFISLFTEANPIALMTPSPFTAVYSHHLVNRYAKKSIQIAKVTASASHFVLLFGGCDIRLVNPFRCSYVICVYIHKSVHI